MVPKSLIFSNCASCGSTELRDHIEFGLIEPVNLSGTGLQIPLVTNYCIQCGLVQLQQTYAQELNFPAEYSFRTGRNSKLVTHFSELADKIRELLPQGKFAIEIGSNDGALLGMLQERGFEAIGIEPTDAADDTPDGISVIRSFFPCDIPFAKSQADVVVIANTFAHVSEPSKVLNSISAALSSNGLLVIEVVDLDKMIEFGEFDKFTHEHRCYFNAETITRMLNLHGFEVTAVEDLTTHGGSIRVFARKATWPVSQIADRPKLPSLADVQKLFAHRTLIRSLVADQHSAGKDIYAVGGTTRGVTLTTVLGLNHFDIIAVTDHPASSRIGHLFPNTLIPIISDEVLFTDSKNKTALLLAWHIADLLIENLRKSGFQGEILIPLPTPRVISCSV